jgi:hypothetical protein
MTETTLRRREKPLGQKISSSIQEDIACISDAKLARKHAKKRQAASLGVQLTQ